MKTDIETTSTIYERIKSEIIDGSSYKTELRTTYFGDHDYDDDSFMITAELENNLSIDIHFSFEKMEFFARNILSKINFERDKKNLTFTE